MAMHGTNQNQNTVVLFDIKDDNSVNAFAPLKLPLITENGILFFVTIRYSFNQCIRYSKTPFDH